MKNNQDGVPLLGCSQSSGEDRHSKSSLESVEDAVLTRRVLSLLRSSVPFAEILTRVLGMAWPTSLNTAQPSLSLSPLPWCTFFTAHTTTWKYLFTCFCLKLMVNATREGSCVSYSSLLTPTTEECLANPYIHSFIQHIFKASISARHRSRPLRIEQGARIPFPHGAYFQVE